jgi:hypothetical protein
MAELSRFPESGNLVIEAIDAAYMEANGGQQAPWTTLAVVRLKREMERQTLTVRQWIACVYNRFSSPEVDVGEMPETFIPYLGRFTHVDAEGSSDGPRSSPLLEKISQIALRCASIKLVEDQGFGDSGIRKSRRINNMAVARKKEPKKQKDAVPKSKPEAKVKSKSKKSDPAVDDAGATQAVNGAAAHMDPEPEPVEVSAPVRSIVRATVAPVPVPGVPGAELSKAFVREAQRLDEKIVKQIDKVSKDIVSLGEMFDEMHLKGYHKALGYVVFADYIQARWPDRSKTQIFQAMRIVRELTTGEEPAVKREDIREMTAQNAEELARVHKAGVTITPEMVQQAKVLPYKRFQEEITMPMMPDRRSPQAEIAGEAEELTPVMARAPEPEVLSRVSYNLSGTVLSRWKRAVEVADWASSGDAGDISYDDRIMHALAAEFLSTWEAPFEEALAAKAREEQHTAQMASDAMGPDVSEAEAEEYRVPEGEAQDAEEAVAVEVASVEGEGEDHEPATEGEEQAVPHEA